MDPMGFSNLRFSHGFRWLGGGGWCRAHGTCHGGTVGHSATTGDSLLAFGGRQKHGGSFITRKKIAVDLVANVSLVLGTEQF